MIHILMGTKAQLIKMLGIMKKLEEEGIEYNYIDTEQHPEITPRLRGQFSVKEPDYSFMASKKDIISNGQGIFWICKILFKSVGKLKKMFKGDKGGICLIHGDTVSTFLGAVLGKLAGQKVGHIEAGFRTPRLLKPFPEEMVRRFVDRISDFNFALSDEAEANLVRDGIKVKKFNVKENTLIDAVEIAKSLDGSQELPDEFILVSIHRYETIFSKERMKFIVDVVLDLAKSNKIVWGLHQPTKKSLERFGIYEKLVENSKVEIRGLFNYVDFIKAISKSRFLITDGGGPQDETRYLNIPCLLMRTENERPNQTHIYQSDFEKEKVDYFVNNLDKFQADKLDLLYSPSDKIVEILKTYL